MSIFHKAKHWAHHAKHKVDHTAHKASHAAEHARHEVSHAADTAAGAVEHAANQAIDEVNQLDITDEIKHEIIGAVEHVKNEAVSTIKAAEKEASEGIQKVANDLKKELEDDFQKMIERLEGQTAQEVLGYLVDVIRTISPSEVGIQLGPIALSLGNLEQKIEHIVKWAENPPQNREAWIAFAQDVAPDSLSLSASIGFALIVESEDLQIEVSATWVGADILANIDNILRKAGIH